MKRLRDAVLFMGLAIVANAQTQLNLQSPSPNQVSNATAGFVGNTGNGTYYYWIIANYPIGSSSPVGPLVVQFAPNPLTGSRYITISWSGTSGATSYDVLGSTTSSFPGTCGACLVGNTASTSINDIGSAKTSYTATSTGPAVATMSLNNSTDVQPFINTQLINNISNLNYRMGMVAGTSTPGHCVQFGVAGTLADAGLACGGGGGGSGVTSFNTRTGVVVLTTADVNAVGTISNTTSGTAAALTTTPTLCTAGTAPTGILPNGNATGCQSVTGVAGVSSFNTRTGAVTLAAADVNAVGAITNSTSGTSAALASTPTLCTAGNAPTGILANGNATGCQSVTGVAGVASFNTRTGTVTLAASDVNAVGSITNSTSGNAGTASALASTPTLCSTGNAPTGILANGNATGCAAIGGGGGGSIDWQSGGVSQGTASAFNTVAGLGILAPLTIGGGAAALNTSIDTAVVPIKTELQSSVSPTVCIDSSASTTAYTPLCGAALTAYSTKQTLTLFINTANTSSTPTANFDTLGAKTLVCGNGTALSIGSLKPGFSYDATYDGTNMRLPQACSQTAISTVTALPTCNGTSEGTRLGVSDALTPVSLSIVAGGGTVHVPVYCNGTNWIVN